MNRKILSLAVVGAVTAIALAAHAKAPMALKSVSVALPKSEVALPAGPNVAVVHNTCLGCHSADMILNQPTMPKAGWTVEVNKMKNVYKAPVDPKDIPAIVDYLTAVKGPK